MIKLLIRLSDDEDGEIVIDEINHGSIQQIVDAAKLLFPKWTSIELILFKVVKEA